MTTASPGPAGDLPGWARIALAVVFLSGIVSRISGLVQNPSLWSDEVRLALNVVSRSFAGLLAPLAWDQTAPVPFLWLTRAIIDIAGPVEWAFRLLPFTAGVALLFLFWRLAKRLLPLEGALLALAMVALSPALIEFSTEFKPYSSDAMIAVALGLLCVDAVTSEQPTSAWVRLSVGGAIAILCSSTALFVLCGVWLAVALAPDRLEHPGRGLRLALMGALWGGTFAGVYFLLLRQTANSEFMIRSWTPHFLTPGTPHLLDRASYITREVIGHFLFARPIGTAQIAGWLTVVVLGLAVVGTLWLFRHRGAWAAVLVAGPILTTLAASMARQYPLWPRLVLFLAPLLFLLLASGTYGLVSRIRHIGLAAGSAIAGTILLGPAAMVAVSTIRQPPVHSDPRDLIHTIVSERKPGDTIYLSGSAVAEWVFYTTDWNAPDTLRQEWFGHMAQSTGPAFANRSSRGHPVDHEGWELRFDAKDGSELLGIASGREFHFMPPFPDDLPDSGWAENEVARIEAEHSPRAWLFFAEIGDMEVDFILSAIEASGAVRQLSMSAPGAAAFLYTLPEAQKRSGNPSGNP